MLYWFSESDDIVILFYGGIMNIAIVDDIATDIQILEHIICSYYQIRHVTPDIHTFSSGEKFFETYLPDAYDLIFLDIYMEQINGMEAAHKIRKASDDCPLIFVTTSRDFAVESYDVHAHYYLLKPFEPEKLCQILDTLQIKKAQDDPFIEVISDRTPVRVPVRSIIFVDTYRNAVQLHTEAGLVRSYVTFQHFEELIQGYSCFLSCYRGCIVNMDRIQEALEEGFLMDNGELVQIRKRGSNAIRKAYLQYLFSVS